MSGELYENLKSMYKSLYLEQEEVKKKINNSMINNYNNSYDYDLCQDQLITLESHIKTLSSIISIYDKCFKSEEILNTDTIIKKVKCEKDYFIKKPLQVLDIQEKERQRIARDLHDTSLQNLTHLVHKIELSTLFIDEDPIKAKLELATVSKSLKSVIQEIRNTIFDLRPMIFDDLGLKESFDRLIDRMKESSKIIIDYNVEELECNNSMVLMTIFRIVEECVNNAIKHSGGNRVSFQLKIDKEGNCIIIVSDNGKSFDAKEVLSVQDRHFGLFILKERVKLLSGTIKIDSKPESGTTVKIIIPLQENQNFEEE